MKCSGHVANPQRRFGPPGSNAAGWSRIEDAWLSQKAPGGHLRVEPPGEVRLLRRKLVAKRIFSAAQVLCNRPHRLPGDPEHDR